MSRSFGWAVSELPSSGDLDPCSRHHTAEHAYTLNYEEPTNDWDLINEQTENPGMGGWIE
jgi:hypothetical protein